MTTVTVDRAVLEQALEALEQCGLGDTHRSYEFEHAARAALRAALAQQAEPVKPVAWIESPHGAIRANPNYKFTFPSQLLHWQIPLYTAPPQRKPLPKHDQHCVDVPGYGLMAVRLVRAIERAHGIKE